MLDVDAKTLRQWLKRSSLSLQKMPTDARVKCLTIEQLHLLANLHGRVLALPAEPSAESHKPSQVVSQTSPASFHDADLPKKLMQLEAQVASQQAQIAHLALQLLQEREQRTEQRLLTLEAFLTSKVAHPFQAQALPDQQQALSVAPDRSSKRARLIPLIESSSSGSYVLICPKEGELHITPDTPEWFAWLSSLSSFRFVGKSGRFSARRGSPSCSHHSWYAQRHIHQKYYCKYLGVSKNVTIARLEEIASILQSYLH